MGKVQIKVELEKVSDSQEQEWRIRLKFCDCGDEWIDCPDPRNPVAGYTPWILQMEDYVCFAGWPAKWLEKYCRPSADLGKNNITFVNLTKERAEWEDNEADPVLAWAFMLRELAMRLVDESVWPVDELEIDLGLLAKEWESSIRMAAIVADWPKPTFGKEKKQGESSQFQKEKESNTFDVPAEQEITVKSDSPGQVLVELHKPTAKESSSKPIRLKMDESKLRNFNDKQNESELKDSHGQQNEPAITGSLVLKNLCCSGTGKIPEWRSDETDIFVPVDRWLKYGKPLNEKVFWGPAELSDKLTITFKMPGLVEGNVDVKESGVFSLRLHWVQDPQSKSSEFLGELRGLLCVYRDEGFQELTRRRLNEIPLNPKLP